MEHYALIDELTESLLRQSLMRLRQYADAGWEIGLAINVSPLMLEDRHAPGRIYALVSEFGIAPERITIEVTETACAGNSAAVLNSLMQLRTRGFEISADDFGTGYSSLQQLSQMPFTEIKIDRMFVAGISHNRKAADILEAIVQLAGKLRMRTVAEGIETQDELDFIQSLGCSAGQGYYLGMPMARRDFIDYLEEASSGMLGHGVNSCAKSVATMRGGHDAIGIMSAAAHTRPAGNGAVVTESIKGAA